MPSGMLTISKTPTSPARFELIFVPNFSGPGQPLGRLTIDTAEELRAVLGDVGVGSADLDKAVREAIRDGVAVVRDIVLTDAFITKHRL